MSESYNLRVHHQRLHSEGLGETETTHSSSNKFEDNIKMYLSVQNLDILWYE